MADDLQGQFRKSGYWLLLVVPAIVAVILLLKGITWPWEVPLTADQMYEQQCAEFAQRQHNASVAKETLLHLRGAAQKFHERYGHWPSTLSELPRSPWSVVPEKVGENWAFEMDEAHNVLRATSKSAMSDGEGKEITLDLVASVWEGYSIEELPVKQPVAEKAAGAE